MVFGLCCAALTVATRVRDSHSAGADMVPTRQQLDAGSTNNRNVQTVNRVCAVRTVAAAIDNSELCNSSRTVEAPGVHGSDGGNNPGTCTDHDGTTYVGPSSEVSPLNMDDLVWATPVGNTIPTTVRMASIVGDGVVPIVQPTIGRSVTYGELVRENAALVARQLQLVQLVPSAQPSGGTCVQAKVDFYPPNRGSATRIGSGGNRKQQRSNISAGSRIIQYTGRMVALLTQEAVDEHANKQHLVRVGAYTYVDAADTLISGVARYIKRPTAGQAGNVRLSVDKHSGAVWVVATKRIRPGEELLLPYNRWLHCDTPLPAPAADTGLGNNGAKMRPNVVNAIGNAVTGTIAISIADEALVIPPRSLVVAPVKVINTSSGSIGAGKPSLVGVDLVVAAGTIKHTRVEFASVIGTVHACDGTTGDGVFFMQFTSTSRLPIRLTPGTFVAYADRLPSDGGDDNGAGSVIRVSMVHMDGTGRSSGTNSLEEGVVVSPGTPSDHRSAGTTDATTSAATAGAHVHHATTTISKDVGIVNIPTNTARLGATNEECILDDDGTDSSRVMVPNTCAGSKFDGQLPISHQKHLQKLQLALTIGQSLTFEQYQQLVELVVKHEAVIAGAGGACGTTNKMEFSIDTGSSAPVRCAAYRYSPIKRAELEKQVQKLNAEGIIRPSTSPWCFPVVLVPKADGKWRMCVDYRKLNAITVKDAFPLPRIDTTLEALGGAAWFSTIDLLQGYHQVPVKPSDICKTAFTTGTSLWEYVKMPFGPTNGPAVFQRLMQLVLVGLQWQVCLVYLDDIIVYSRTYEEHLESLDKVLAALAAAGLTTRTDKCVWCSDRVRFLGHVVSGAGITPQEDKCKAIVDYPSPNAAAGGDAAKISALRCFLGMVGYYRRYIPGFSAMAAPLFKLVGSNSKWQWSTECDSAVSKLKVALTTAPVLISPNYSIPFVVKTDASGVGIGGALVQVIDGHERPVDFISRVLTPAERNYSTTERECLAVVWCIHRWRYHLEGGLPFIVITDHNCLRSLNTSEWVNARVARWSLLLQSFSFTVEYRKGKLHSDVDALSRSRAGSGGTACHGDMVPVCFPTRYIGPIDATSSEEDKALAVLPKIVSDVSTTVVASVTNDATASVVTGESDPVAVASAAMVTIATATEEIVKQQQLDPLLKAISLMVDSSSGVNGTTAARISEICTATGLSAKTVKRWYQKKWQFELHNGVLLHHAIQPNAHGIAPAAPSTKLVVPVQLVPTVLEQLHGSMTGGHSGIHGTLSKAHERFWWPRLYRDVVMYVNTCPKCQQLKGTAAASGVTNAPRSYTGITQPFAVWSVDVIGPLPPTSTGYKYVLTMTEWLSRYMVLRPLKTVRTIPTAEAFIDGVVSTFGVPARLVSDNGTNFVSKLAKAVYVLLGIRKTDITALHPASNGITERSNADVKRMVVHLCNDHRSNWDRMLPFIQLSHNAVTHSTTKHPPFTVLFGQQVKLPVDALMQPLQNVCDDGSSQTGTQSASDNVVATGDSSVDADTAARNKGSSSSSSSGDIAAGISIYDYVNELKIRLQQTHALVLRYLIAGTHSSFESQLAIKPVPVYAVGELVMVYGSSSTGVSKRTQRLAGHAGTDAPTGTSKLEYHWYGPYVVRRIRTGNVYEVERVHKSSHATRLNYQTVNVARLKRYHVPTHNFPLPPTLPANELLPMNNTASSVGDSISGTDNDATYTGNRMVLPCTVSSSPMALATGDATNESVTTGDGANVTTPIELPLLRRSQRKTRAVDPGPCVRDDSSLDESWY
jgi:hypothetical protein